MNNDMLKINSCEVCGNTKLETVLNLGNHPMCDDLVEITLQTEDGTVTENIKNLRKITSSMIESHKNIKIHLKKIYIVKK